MTGDGHDARKLVSSGVTGKPLWSRDSNEFVYPLGDSVHVVDARSATDHEATAAELIRIGWSPLGPLSPDRRWIAQSVAGCPVHCRIAGIEVVRVSDKTGRALFARAFAAWSPNGKWLGLEDHHRIPAEYAR
jgi:hypothetical protein